MQHIIRILFGFSPPFTENNNYWCIILSAHNCLAYCCTFDISLTDIFPLINAILPALTSNMINELGYACRPMHAYVYFFSQFYVGEGLLPRLVFFVTFVRRTYIDYEFFCDFSEQLSVTFHLVFKVL